MTTRHLFLELVDLRNVLATAAHTDYPPHRAVLEGLVVRLNALMARVIDAPLVDDLGSTHAVDH